MFRILTLDPIAASGLARFPAGHYRVGADVEQPDAVLARSTGPRPMPAGISAVGCTGADLDGARIVALSALGVPVFKATGANANAVKELVLAGMLLAVRHLPEALRFLREQAEDVDLESVFDHESTRFVGSELAGRTLGVIGLGAVGVQVANAARTLGMRVLGLDPYMSVDGAWQLSAEVMKAGSLNELYAGSDFVSVHVPLTEATRHLLDAGSLTHLRRGVVLLNLAHPELFDHAAVLAGIAEGRIARYVTDFPVPELAGSDTVIALPRLGAATREAEENSAIMVVEQLRDFLENGNVSNSVNFPALSMARSGSARVCVANHNRPNMIGGVSAVLGAGGLNIAQMRNASKGEVGYTLVDVDSAVPEATARSIAAVDGVLSVRVV